MSDKISLDKFLQNIEENSKELSEAHIYDELRKIKTEDKDDELKIGYESIAFGFTEDYMDKPNGWGNYYGPMMVFKDKDGKWMESPSIKLVDDNTIEYWAERAMKAKHPLMTLRYADLIWEFSKKIINKAASINMAHLVIDNTINVIESKSFQYEINAIIKLKRALSIAISINDDDRIKKLIELIIKFEDEIAIDNKPGLWGFSFDCLIDKKKLIVDEKQETKIISDLESRLHRLSQNDKSLDAHSSEAASVRLLRYYRSKNDKTNAERILSTYGQAFIWTAERNKGMIASHWLQKVYELYSSNGLKKDAEKVSQLLLEANKTINDEMKEVSKEFKIDKDIFKKFIDEITGNNLIEALNKIAWHFLPDDENIKKEVLDIAKKTPIQAFITHSIMDREGRTVAKVGSVEEDIEGRVVQLMSQHFQYDHTFLYHSIREAKKKYSFNSDDIINFIYESPLFLEERKEIIKRGIEAYFNDDFIVAAHLLIPQIENALRMMLRLNGGDIYKPAKNGGLFLRNLDEILRSQAVTENFTERVTKYFRVLLTDQRGFNLRNDICHGIMQPDHIGFYVCDRLFHVILLLAQVRSKEETG
ncbi:MAG: hypothetical protein DAHOPDDO_01422 [Ignavibacteriaceae bacterium]|nr:hypothetical protein [Ignavibacteriaceae bacterium]